MMQCECAYVTAAAAASIAIAVDFVANFFSRSLSSLYIVQYFSLVCNIQISILQFDVSKYCWYMCVMCFAMMNKNI